MDKTDRWMCERRPKKVRVKREEIIEEWIDKWMANRQHCHCMIQCLKNFKTRHTIVSNDKKVEQWEWTSRYILLPVWQKVDRVYQILEWVNRGKKRGKGTNMRKQKTKSNIKTKKKEQQTK